MKIYILLGLLLSQSSFASPTNPEWNLKPKLEQRISSALGVSSSYHAQQLNKSMDSFVTVGGDSTCDFRVGSSKIQNAIDSGASEIRIASNKVYEEIITINNPAVNLSLRGGFADCVQANLNNQSDLVDDWTQITHVSTQSGSVFNNSTIVGGGIFKRASSTN